MERQILEKYKQSADRAVKWLVLQLKSDDSYGSNINDLASYYKSPYLFSLSGKLEKANRMLNHIKKKFMRKNGDFTTSSEMKSENGAFVEYWAYMNAWITLAAQKMGRFDIAYPAHRYLKSFYHPKPGGFTTNQPYGQANNVVDIFSTAHLGLTSLYFGDLEVARAAGNLLQSSWSLQPHKKSECYLRLTPEGKLITDFPADAAIFFVVSAKQPHQAYFMIGYPIAFLGKLYQATGEARYLNTARDYLDFALTCHDNIRSFHFSHKVAWGAAIIANLTKETKYLELATDIADYLLSIQESSGAWLTDQPAHTSFDQTAEIAIWLKEISAELGNF